jgi:Mrp family chromosome partitioning ATPase
MSDALASNFQLLRVRIESDVKLSSVILVTSALPNDGKSLLAFGLAEVLARVGHRTALIDTTAPHDDRDGRVPEAIPEAIDNAVDQLRADYDYAIIDAPPLTTNGTSMVLAGSVDAVLVAVRHGRTPSDADKIMVHTLRQLKAKVLGVIASAPESIADFEKRRERCPTGPARSVVVEPRVDDVPTSALFAR